MGFNLPNIGETKSMQGRIESMENVYNFNLGVQVQSKFKVGDLVLYPAMGSNKVIVDREEYIICGIMDLLAVIEE